MRTLTSEQALLHNRDLLIKTWAVRRTHCRRIETLGGTCSSLHIDIGIGFFFSSFRSPQLVVSRTFTFFTSHLPLNDSAFYDGNGERWSEVLNCDWTMHWLQPRQSSPENRFSCYESWRRWNIVCRYLIVSYCRCQRKIQLAAFFPALSPTCWRHTRNRGDVLALGDFFPR